MAAHQITHKTVSSQVQRWLPDGYNGRDGRNWTRREWDTHCAETTWKTMWPLGTSVVGNETRQAQQCDVVEGSLHEHSLMNDCTVV